MKSLKTYQTVTIIFLMCFGIVNYLDRSALSIANTTIQKDMLISPSEMGILLSAFSLAYAFAQLPMGMMIGRQDPQRVVRAP
jgi:sugar phosphate permease